MPLPREIKILAGLYSFTGLYCSAIAALLLYAIMTGRWWFWVEAFMIVVAVVFAFFLVAYELLRRRRWARTLGLVLSGLATVTMLLMLMPIHGVVEYWLAHPNLTYPELLLDCYALASLSLLVTHPLCLYYLTRPNVKAYFST